MRKEQSSRIAAAIVALYRDLPDGATVQISRGDTKILTTVGGSKKLAGRVLSMAAREVDRAIRERDPSLSLEFSAEGFIVRREVKRGSE